MNKLLLIPVVGLVYYCYLVGYYKPEFTLNEIRYFQNGSVSASSTVG